LLQHQEPLHAAQREPTVPAQGRPRPEDPSSPPPPEIQPDGQAGQQESAAPQQASAPVGFSRLPSLTGLRWLAAFIVFGFHMGTLGVFHSPVTGPQSAGERAWEAVFDQGDIGVAFFYILSGFVLTWVAKPTDTRTAFLRRRVAKIYPNHIATWAIVLGIAVLWGDRISKVVAVLNLALVQPWFYGSYHGFSIGYSVNTVSWSLGCEAFFYLCFPFVLPLLRDRSTVQLYWTAFVLLGVTFCCQQWQFYLFPHSPAHSYWFVYMFPPVRSLEFWLGVITALLVRRKRWYGPGLKTAMVITVGAYYLNGTDRISLDLHTDIFDTVCCLLIAAAARADLAGAWSPWRWRPLVFLGEISFAFYLVHVELVQNVMRLWRPEGWHGTTALLVIPALLAIAIGLAYLLYRFVEMPFMRLLRPKTKKS
jgi:peptidoglycan/LPS O-acetylase OafA/YrhL